MDKNRRAVRVLAIAVMAAWIAWMSLGWKVFILERELSELYRISSEDLDIEHEILDKLTWLKEYVEDVHIE